MSIGRDEGRSDSSGLIEDIERCAVAIQELGGDFKPKDFKVGLSVDEGLELLSSLFEPFELQ
jgi:hypothetical protein